MALIYVWELAYSEKGRGLDCVQFGRGSIEGVGEPREGELWNVSGEGCVHRAAGGQEEGRAGRLPLAAPPSLCVSR